VYLFVVDVIWIFEVIKTLIFTHFVSNMYRSKCVLLHLCTFFGQGKNPVIEALLTDVIGTKVLQKLQSLDPESLINFLRAKSSQIHQLDPSNQQVLRESINSPSNRGSSKRSKKRSSTVAANNEEQCVDAFANVLATPGTSNSCSVSTYVSCVGTLGTKIEYDPVSGEIRRTDAGKTFMNRLRESFLQRFRDHIHLTFSKIPLHLKKMVIQDMESEFGAGWSVTKVKSQMTENCKRFRCNQTRKIKKIPQDQRLKQRPFDIPMKVWKELVKSHEKLEAQRKAGEEITQVLNFSLNMIFQMY